ncbi:interferon-inducible GTPase 5-like [Microcaecilia unicolor]|uniref:Interferon-inducible GTPase 5-like n=1 Tax=Microcaecilia unicolor TaxID=1415580 RepID=A0A6P7WVT2_9AMPH|nr:interferon-inducible GTPase 5-like [Microcaecilia unicolor]
MGDSDHNKKYGIISQEEFDTFKAAVEGVVDLTEAALKILENLKLVESVKVNIAVTGKSGSGTSTFVNAIRGLDDEEEGSAKRGVNQITLQPIPYPHPKNHNIIIWDLPGIGTRNFQAHKYLEQVNFSQYDFFIIIASKRFKSNHVKLARDIQDMGKKFYFVRSKVDADVDASKRRRKSSYDEGKILDIIRTKCTENLENKGVKSPQVFLITSWDLEKYDFPLLRERLQAELPIDKRNAFLLSLPNISSKVLEKKKEALKQHIWKLATVSCTIAVIPVPGLSVACDVVILVNALSNYCKAFGLDEESLAKLAKKVNKPIDTLKAAIKSPVAHEISVRLVYKLLTKAAGGALSTVEYFLSTIPVFGSLAAGGISFGTTYYMLNSFVNDLEKDAQNVLHVALYETQYSGPVLGKGDRGGRTGSRTPRGPTSLACMSSCLRIPSCSVP